MSTNKKISAAYSLVIVNLEIIYAVQSIVPAAENRSRAFEFLFSLGSPLTDHQINAMAEVLVLVQVQVALV